MAKKPVITLLKNGNILLVSPTTPDVFDLLKPVLTYTEKKSYHGYEAKKRIRQGKSSLELVERSLFELDYKDRIATMFGFWSVIRKTLRQAGYTVCVKEVSGANPRAMEPRWQNIRRYKLRDHQPEFVKKVLKHRCGRFDCPPGFGKSFMIGIIAALLPKARIDVVTKRVAVLRDRIYPELVQMVGDVGIVGGGRNVRNKRVMCYTVGSLHHARADDCDILFGDECHELAADKASQELTRWQNSRNYGLSASHDMRWDGKDMRVHGLFGPIVFRVNYTGAMKADMVVPLKIIWSSVAMDYDPCGSLADVEKKRYGIWRNEYRNSIIAADARRYSDDTQVLITVETIEHAMQLKKLLPEFTLVYMENGLSEDARYRYAKEGCCSFDEPLMTSQRRARLTSQFEKGALKKVICTTVWNVGVSFNKLACLIRADGGGSQINDIQIPGRVSRTADGKECGIVHDYLDQFNYGYKQRAIRRMRSYQENRWEQVFPPDSNMAQYLERRKR